MEKSMKYIEDMKMEVEEIKGLSAEKNKIVRL